MHGSTQSSHAETLTAVSTGRWYGKALEKSKQIQKIVSALKQELSAYPFEIVDYWPEDPHTIGVCRPGEVDPCVCILTRDKADDAYDLQHGGMIFRDCLVQGVVGTVRGELRRDPNDEVSKPHAKAFRGHRAPSWFVPRKFETRKKRRTLKSRPANSTDS